jgi:TRAP-type C4-dicarboxylate transport system permease small subunit
LKSFLDKAARAGSLAEDILLILILSMMIILAGGQILLRNVFDIGFIWGDELLRMLVLWIAVAGAVAASRSDKHISIAILDRFLPEFLKSLSKIVINIFTASVTGAVAWFSLQFALTSREYGDILLGSVPAWWLQLILPVGFGLIAYRYIVMTFKVVIALLTGERVQIDSESGES